MSGKRVPISFRATPEMKRLLDKSAKQNGRSQSQDIEYRLQQSFDREALLDDVRAAIAAALGERFVTPAQLDAAFADERERARKGGIAYLADKQRRERAP